MYKGTYDKIQSQASFLKKLHSKGRIENLELFDEPYKVALKILDCRHLDGASAAKHLGLNKETVKQIRSALNIN